MADPFDQFLARSLAPEQRLPDRRFVAQVEARILLEEQLERERRALVANVIKQLIALLAVAAAAWMIGNAGPVAEAFAQTPAVGLLLLLVAFGFVVALFSRPTASGLRLQLAS